MFSLKGRTAIVSGAGAGIGLAVAQALAEAGANVAIWYNSNKKAVIEAEKIEKEYGVKCKFSFFLDSFCVSSVSMPRSCDQLSSVNLLSLKPGK
jgi:NAD(P)-dependent dehydrogenase (short-subunit alcohol dehydrogenase family)